MFELSAENSPQSALTLDGRQVVLGLWRRRRLLCLLFVVSILVGVLASRRLSADVWTSETTLLYDMQAFRTAWDRDPLPPALLASRVTSPAVTAAAARALGMSTEGVAQAASADVDRDSSVLRIRAQSRHPQDAQTMCRALRSAFESDLRASLVAEKKNDISRLRDVYEHANEAVRAAADDVQAFLLANRVNAADMTLGPPSGAVEQMRLVYSETRAETDALQRQREGLQATIRALHARAAEEVTAARAAAQDTRSERRTTRLLAVVQDERGRQANEIALRQSEVEMRRARDLFKEGYLSRQELERACEAYQRNRASLADNGHYQDWRRMSARLIAPSPTTDGAAPASQSESLLTQLVHQDQTLALQISALQRRTASLRLQYLQALGVQQRLPHLQRQYDEVAHVLALRQAERTEAHARLARAEDVAVSDATTTPGLALVSDANLPAMPTRSRRKLIGLLMAGGGLLASLAFVMITDLRDRRLKSPSQLSTHLSLPVLGTIPRVPQKALASRRHDALGADFAAMARRLREQVPGRGARVLLISPGPSEGKSLVAAGLAHELSQQGERVVVLDAATSSRRDASRAHLDATLSAAARENDIVLIEGVALDETNAARLAASVDAVVLVIENHIHQIDTLRHLVDALQRQETPLVGGIVTKVDPLPLALESLPV